MREGRRKYRGTQSFRDAIRGIATVFRTEWNFRIHCMALMIVLLLGIFFRISEMEWIAVVIVAGLVLSMELLNTGLEYLADTLHPEQARGIGLAKDAAAGGVLIAALAAAIVGAIIFLPKIWMLLVK